MDVRSLKLTMHVMPSGDVYWALSVDAGRGRRYVCCAGVVSSVLEPDRAPLTVLLSECAAAARAVLDE